MLKFAVQVKEWLKEIAVFGSHLEAVAQVYEN